MKNSAKQFDDALLKLHKTMAGKPDQIGWKQSEPPKDGTRIVAIGQVNGHDDFGGFAEPFLQTIHWQKTDSGFEGWMCGDLALVTCLEDQVKIHFWIEYPVEVA